MRYYFTIVIVTIKIAVNSIARRFEIKHSYHAEAVKECDEHLRLH